MTRFHRVAWAGVAGLAACISACVGPPLVLTPTELDSAVQGVSYTATLGTADGVNATWSVVEGTLPPGLSLGRGTGVLSGTPTTPGTYDFRVRASRFPPQRAGEDWFTITVVPRLEIGLALPEARVGVAYDYTPAISGGVPPYVVEVLGLPAGMEAEATAGRITGTPLFDSDGLTILVNVTDGGTPEQSASASGTLVIKPRGVAITTESLLSAAVSWPYSTQVQAQDGKRPYVWTVVAGVLPDGLRLTQATGVISGIPTAQSQTREFTLRVTDSDVPASVDDEAFKIIVPVVLATTSLPTGARGQTYEAPLDAAAGLPPYSWEVVGGQLPNGLVLDSVTGVLFGTLAADAQSQTFTVRVTDSDTPTTSAERGFTLTVNP